LANEIAGVEEADQAAGQNAAASGADRRQAAQAERRARTELRTAEAPSAAARAAEAEIARRVITDEARLAAAIAAVAALATDLAEVRAQAEETDRELAALPEPTLARAALDGARAAAVEARRRESDARTALERLTREAEARRARLSAIEIEERSWGKR